MRVILILGMGALGVCLVHGIASARRRWFAERATGRRR